jgi:predicted DNA-binding transcriptional regulator AlpA
MAEGAKDDEGSAVPVQRGPQTLPGGRVVDERELAEMLGISVSVVSKWRRQGSGGPRFIQVSEKLVRYQIRDVQEWLDERKGKK